MTDGSIHPALQGSLTGSFPIVVFYKHHLGTNFELEHRFCRKRFTKGTFVAGAKDCLEGFRFCSQSAHPLPVSAIHRSVDGRKANNVIVWWESISCLIQPIKHYLIDLTDSNRVQD